MDIEVKEKEDGKLRLEVDADMAFINAVNDYVWEEKGVKISAYNRSHPYAAKPEILIKATNPEKVLTKALDKIIADANDLKKKFEKQV